MVTISTPYRQCWHMDERGMQCETWFPAIDDNKLCESHRNGISVKDTPQQKVLYIDLVNDQRDYCYHFKDGSAQSQSKTLIYEFKDDQSGSIFEKLDAHIAFLEKVLEDQKARLHATRAVKAEKLDSLSEEQRKELRKIKISKELTPEKSSRPTKVEKTTADWKEKLASIGASLDMSPDEMIAKFKAMQAKKEGE